jgi:hypothetical protein
VDQREECKKKKKKKKKKKEEEIRAKDNYQRRKTVALAQVLNDMALEIFTDGERVARLQRKYLCHTGLMIDGIRVDTFIRRLKQISHYLPYFPMRLVDGRLVQLEPIPEDALVDMLDAAISDRWATQNLRTGKATEDFSSLTQVLAYYRKFQQADDRSGTTKIGESRKRRRDQSGRNEKSKEKGGGQRRGARIAKAHS